MPKRIRQKTTYRRKKRLTIEDYAMKNKRNPTKAELKLWTELKRKMKHWGVTFEFQGIVIGRFIADFVCYEKMLIIEVDGGIHNLKHVKAKDKVRTTELNRFGFYVIRFSNYAVLRFPHAVVDTIYRTIMRIGCE